MIGRTKAFIVEDEAPARKALKALLEDYADRIEVVGEAENVSSALEKIKEQEPAILFLDIQLGDEQSFSLLEKLNHKRYQLIFITAYNEFAVSAFEFSACDYLLKPINPDRLQEAVANALERIRNQHSADTLEVLLSNLGNRDHRKIVLSTLEMMHIVDTRQIYWCQSSQNYTTFHLEDGKELIISRTLKEFENMLSAYGFFRIHKSWLVNTSWIQGYDKREGGYVIMPDGKKIPVSDQKKEELKRIIEQLQ